MLVHTPQHKCCACPAAKAIVGLSAALGQAGKECLYIYAQEELDPDKPRPCLRGPSSSCASTRWSYSAWPRQPPLGSVHECKLDCDSGDLHTGLISAYWLFNTCDVLCLHSKQVRVVVSLFVVARFPTVPRECLRWDRCNASGTTHNLTWLTSAGASP